MGKKKDTFTAMVPKPTPIEGVPEDELEFESTQEFDDWYESLQGLDETKVFAAIDKAKKEGCIPQTKKLPNGLYERKWKKTKLRLYFAVIIRNGKETLLLLGSKTEKDQQKAIDKCTEMLDDYEVHEGNLQWKDQ